MGRPSLIHVIVKSHGCDGQDEYRIVIGMRRP